MNGLKPLQFEVLYPAPFIATRIASYFKIDINSPEHTAFFEDITHLIKNEVARQITQMNHQFVFNNPDVNDTKKKGNGNDRPDGSGASKPDRSGPTDGSANQRPPDNDETRDNDNQDVEMGQQKRHVYYEDDHEISEGVEHYYDLDEEMEDEHLIDEDEYSDMDEQYGKRKHGNTKSGGAASKKNRSRVSSSSGARRTNSNDPLKKSSGPRVELALEGRPAVKFLRTTREKLDMLLEIEKNAPKVLSHLNESDRGFVNQSLRPILKCLREHCHNDYDLFDRKHGNGKSDFAIARFRKRCRKACGGTARGYSAKANSSSGSSVSNHNNANDEDDLQISLSTKTFYDGEEPNFHPLSPRLSEYPQLEE